MLLLKGLYTDSLIYQHTHSKPQCRGSSTKRVRDIRGGTKLTNFRWWARGAGFRTTLSRERNSGRCHCSPVELSSHPASPVQVSTKSVLSMSWLTLFTLPSDSLGAGPSHIAHPARACCRDSSTGVACIGSCYRFTQRITNLT